MIYNTKHVGCWADGALGHGHIRSVLADLCDANDHFALGDLLRGEMSDDAYEEEDALKMLNDRSVGVVFCLEDGDLMCTKEEGDDHD
jgi:hypothetical protein